ESFRYFHPLSPWSHGQDDCPPLPPGISPPCRDFLMQCFQKEPVLRADAQQLLRHRWIRSHRRQNSGSQPTEGEGEVSDMKEQVKSFNMLRTKTVYEIILS